MSKFEGFHKTRVVLYNEKNLFPSEYAQRTSPTGYGWGYRGLGAQALAHTILRLFEEEDNLFADQLHLDFTVEVLENLPGDEDFTLTREEVVRWISDRSYRLSPQDDIE